MSVYVTSIGIKYESKKKDVTEKGVVYNLYIGCEHVYFKRM